MSGAGTLYVAIKGDTKDLIAALKAAKAESISYGKAAKQAIDPVSASFTTLGRSVAGLGASFLGLQGIKAVVGIADQYSLLDSKLKLVTNSTAEYTKVHSELFRISQNTGSSFAANTAAFSGLSLALRDTKITSEETLKIFEDVNKSLVVSGVNTAEATSFMLQFKQALGSGKLAGDELKGMLESNGYWGGLLAKSLGVATGELKNLGAEGKLTTEVLLKAFPEMAQQIDQDFQKIEKTISRAMVELSNSFNDIVANANKTTGGTNSVASSISDLANTITDNKETISMIFVGMIEGARVAVEGISNVANSARALGIVAASKDKTIFDWIKSGPEDVKAWVKEIDNGTAFLKDRLVEITEQIRSSRGEDKSNIPALLAEKKAIRERIIEIQNSTVAEDEAIAKSIAGVEKRLGVEAKATNSFIDSWQGKRDISITMAKEIAEAEDKYYTDQEEKAKKAYEKSKEIKHLKASDEFDGLELQKKVYHETLKEEKKLSKEQEQLSKQGEDETASSLARMTSLIKSSKRTEVEVWQDAIDKELEEFERLSDGSKEYTDAIAEYREIKNKELLDRISRNEKDNLTDMGEMWLDFAHGAQGNFSEFFSSALKGEFDSIGEAFQSLCDSMVDSFIDAVADMAAREFASLIFGTASGSSTGTSIAGTGLAWFIDAIMGTQSSATQGGQYQGWEAGAGANSSNNYGMGDKGSGSSSGSGVAGTVGGLVTTAVLNKIYGYVYENTAKPAVSAAYDSASQYLSKTYDELQTAYTGYNSAPVATETVSISNESVAAMGSEVGAQVGSELSTATQGGQYVGWEAGAAAEGAGSSAAPTATAASGEAMGVIGMTAMETNIIAYIAMFAAMMTFKRKPTLNDNLNATGYGMERLSEKTGVVDGGGIQAVTSDFLELNNRFRAFSEISIDSSANLMVLGSAIQSTSERGQEMTTGMVYTVETFNAAAGTWEKTRIDFDAMIAQMEELGPTTVEAIEATADYVAEMNNVAVLSDELAYAYSQAALGTDAFAQSIALVGGAFENAAGQVISAAEMMNGISIGIDMSGFYSNEYRDEGRNFPNNPNAISTPATDASYYDEPLGHAAGGIHKGGWRIVGERGPELEYTPPSRIFSNPDTKSLLAGAGSQTTNLTIPVSVGNEPLTTLMVRIADGVATVRQRQNVTGGAYRL